MRRGLEKLAVSAAALALAGAAPNTAASEETPKSNYGATPVENTNQYLQNQAQTLGQLILNHPTELLLDTPTAGEATAIIDRADILGFVRAKIVAVMGEVHGQPDPHATEMVSIEASFKHTNLEHNGQFQLTLDKEINLFGKNAVWRALQCNQLPGEPKLCSSNLPAGARELKDTAQHILGPIDSQVKALTTYPDARS